MSHAPGAVVRPYVAVEGIDGAGKTTLVRHVRARLAAEGVPTLSFGQHCWLDPDATRTIMRARAEGPDNPEARGGGDVEAGEVAAAYARDAQMQQRHCLAPALAHQPVIQDRCFLSSAVYNDVLFGVPLRRSLESLGALPHRPALLVFCDVTADEGLERTRRRTSKAPAPWEQRAQLERLAGTYRAVVGRGAGELLGRVLWFRNVTSREWLARVDEQVLPEVRAQLAAATGAPAAGSR